MINVTILGTRTTGRGLGCRTQHFLCRGDRQRRLRFPAETREDFRVGKHLRIDLVFHLVSEVHA